MRLLLLAVGVLSVSLLSSVEAAPPDPRPVVLVLGDQASAPFRNSPGWPQVMSQLRPGWNVQVRVQDKWTLAQWEEGVSGLLEGVGPVAAVVVFMGTVDSSPGTGPLDASEKSYGSLLEKVAGHSALAGAKKLAVTPVPVVEARLDKWSLERFGQGGQERSTRLAAAMAAAAQTRGWTVEDVHALIFKDESDGKPGRLVGSIGWLPTEAAHPVLAEKLAEALDKLAPAPADLAAYENWQKERLARLELIRILASTSEGMVSIQEPPAPGVEMPKGFGVEIPAAWLEGAVLDLVVTPGEKPWSLIGHDGNLPAYRSILAVKTAEGDVNLPVKASMMRMIDEARPEGGWQVDRFSLNAGKMNTFAVTSSVAGERRWVLVRFDLAPLSGKKIESARLGFLANQVEIRAGPEVKGTLPSGDTGAPVVRRIAWTDADWIPNKATWKTRDGTLGWSGGAVRAEERKAALESFLAGQPPAAVAEQARTFLP
jgi:hypothetical protein